MANYNAAADVARLYRAINIDIFGTAGFCAIANVSAPVPHPTSNTSPPTPAKSANRGANSLLIDPAAARMLRRLRT